jgi:hypothetical protein
MHARANGLRRIYIPRTWVNKGKKKKEGRDLDRCCETEVKRLGEGSAS